MRIAFCSSEVFPFAKTGGLGDVCGALPSALKQLNVDVNIFLPKYRGIDETKFTLEKVRDYVYSTKLENGIKVFLIEHKGFFDREGLYADQNGAYSDNLERFQYFCEGVIKTVDELDLPVDIFHCHDWHAALLPVLVKKKYALVKRFKQTKAVLTIHNLAFQGNFPLKQYAKLDIPRKLNLSDDFEIYGQMNLLKAGILNSDHITAVSPGYSKEIMTKEFGCGLEDVIKKRKSHLSGILNGLDYNIWNPKTDGYLKSNYDEKSFSAGKKENKKQLLQKFHLNVDAATLVLGMVGRLSHQKGLELIVESLEELLKRNVCVVIQGVGEEKYVQELKKIKQMHKDKIGLCFEFDEQMAHLIYAGSDFFMMPSVFEPCGLSQMISFAYGTLPIVYKTGGLADTVIDWKKNPSTGNGIVFEKYQKSVFMDAVLSAQKIFQEKEPMNRIIQKAFNTKFFWEDSARKYKDLYQCLLSA